VCAANGGSVRGGRKEREKEGSGSKKGCLNMRHSQMHCFLSCFSRFSNLTAHDSPSSSQTVSDARFLLPCLLASPPFQALTSSISADKSLLATKFSYCNSTSFLKEDEVHAAVTQDVFSWHAPSVSLLTVAWWSLSWPSPCGASKSEGS